MQVTMAKTEREEDQLCDFCSSQERPFKLFACNDHETNDEIAISTGGWLACPICAKLVEAHDTEALLQRSIETLHDPSIPEWFSRQSLRAIHQKFFQNMQSEN